MFLLCRETPMGNTIMERATPKEIAIKGFQTEMEIEISNIKRLQAQITWNKKQIEKSAIEIKKRKAQIEKIRGL